MMEARATPIRSRSSANSFSSYNEDNPVSPRSASVSRRRISDDVLSVNSWSDISSASRDLDGDPDFLVVDSNIRCRSVSGTKKNGQKVPTRLSPGSESHPRRRSAGNPITGSASLYNDDDHFQYNERHDCSNPQSYRSRSRSSSSTNNPALYRVPPQKSIHECATDFMYDTDQPDFSYISPHLFKDFPLHSHTGEELLRIRSTDNTDYNKSDKTINKKPPSLYPVLDDLEKLSTNEDSRARSVSLYTGEWSDGPASMPEVNSSSDLEKNPPTPFRSLSSSILSRFQPTSHKKGAELPSPLKSQGKSQNHAHSHTEKTWSLWPHHQSQPIISKAATLRRQPKSSSDLEAMRESFEHRLEHDNVKTKVMSAWNNFKYGWMFNTKPSIKHDSPLYLLGKCYHISSEGNSGPAEDFQKDFTSRIWMTYRTNFYPIPGTKLNTDCGWGCMLRSAQMLIIQCLVTHFLGRDWRLHNPQTETEQAYYREIIRWFSDPVDAPSDKMPFSLHHLVSFGRHYHKEPGEWFGPSSAAYIFRDAFVLANKTLPILSQLCVYVAQDCTVYLDDVKKLCTARDKSESWSNSNDAETHKSSQCEDSRSQSGSEEIWLRSLIILIPMRLGGEVMNEIYVPCVKNLLTQENCMGIIGGKPRHSLYFIGWQDNKLIHLDPHFCREAVDTTDKNFKIETYHCMSPRKLTITKMDPSCTVGFYIRNATEFRKFVEEVREYVCPENQRGAYPLFIFSEGSHNESYVHDVHTGAERGRVKITHYQIDKNGHKQRTFSKDSEDFVIL